MCCQVAKVRRLPRSYLQQRPVDLLALGNLGAEQHAAWLERVKYTHSPPRFVFEFWPENSLFSDSGPVSKVQVTKWSNAQSKSTCRLINSTQVGGVVDRRWLVVIRYRSRKNERDLKWPNLGGEVTRPMNNCLRPNGIPYAAYRRCAPHNKSRSSIGDLIPHSDKDSMPAWPGSLIETSRGVRRMLNDELARGLGVPKAWLGEAYPRPNTVRHTIAVYILEDLSELLVETA
jgi:hypothetical protein